MSSTLPLAKRFLQRGYEVDYYVIVRDRVKQLDAIPISINSPKVGINKIPAEQIGQLMEYMEYGNFAFHTIRLLKPCSSIPVLRSFTKIINEMLIRNTCRSLNRNVYSFVNIVTRYSSTFMSPFATYLKSRIIFSLHEVCNHLNPDFEHIPALVHKIFEKGCDIVVHSQKTLNDIIKYKEVQYNKLHCINFGLFETYNLVKPDENLSLPENYALFFGIINKYKGLDFLYDIIRQCKHELHNMKIVIAGNGVVPVLDNIKQDDTFCVINRYITNEELVTLFGRCKFVICPYTSASQSGLPQTAFVFNKPIISSDIESFQEVLKNEYGCAIPLTDKQRWNDTLLELSMDGDTYSTLVSNVKNFTSYSNEYSWDYISEQYLEILDIK